MTGTVTTAALDPSDDRQVAEFFDLFQAVHAADTPDNPAPLREVHRTTLQQQHTEARLVWEAARADGELLGVGFLAMPTVDNLHVAQTYVWVHPHHRRRGAGRALLAKLVGRARDESRTVLIGQAVGPAPDGPPRDDAGARFLEATGFAPALPTMRRRVDLSAVDHADEQALWADCLPHAGGYDIVHWTGSAPDQLAPGVAYLANRVATDAPRGEMDLDETTLDAKRMRAEEQQAFARGTHLVGAAAVHRATGQVVAATRIDVRPPGDHGDVWLTIAHPEHRGHRLGTLVKIEAHRRVRELFPGLRYVTTGNADANAHMVGINERLGYRPFETATIYQLQL